MDEHTNPDFQGYDEPAPTGSQSTRPPRRRGGGRRPTQTEILTGNVQALTQTVQVLVDAFRDTRNVQLPQQPPEAAESTPSRPPRSASRRRDPSPVAARSGRSQRESAGRQPRNEGEPSRLRSRSRHTRVDLSDAPNQPAPAGDNPQDVREEIANVRRNTPSVFDRLGRPDIYRRLGREVSVDQPAERENRDQSRLDYLQRQLDRLVGQQCGLEPTGTAEPPFTPSIMESPYPTRFKMPTIPSYDGSTDADEHVENYQAHMLIQSANEAALCKSFCLTLTGAARQWYRRLPPGSIGSFQQLASSFSAAFLGSRTRKLGASHLFSIKQRESETLKKYLERFDKAVVQVENCSDDTLAQALKEGVKDPRLVWTLAYDRTTSFTHLRGIAWRHAEADEYVRARGLEIPDHDRPTSRKSERGQPRSSDQNRGDRGKNPARGAQVETNRIPRAPEGKFTQYTPLVTNIEHVLNQVSDRGLLRDPPPIRTDRSRRNPNKYCHYHKDIGHDTKNCIQLRDQIELLIREGHLQEFVERIITPTGQSSHPAPTVRQNPGTVNRTEEPEPEHIVHTIFGGTATGDTASSRRSPMTGHNPSGLPDQDPTWAQPTRVTRPGSNLDKSHDRAQPIRVTRPRSNLGTTYKGYPTRIQLGQVP
ncbi:hypothetical protein TIFTF001_044306 [Ficus carica]|uniref:Retrotransposon gag domain-containing protein n=1 Tax=Ficus carica TaxID=3494 RepID=A0AA87Z414_FICCA|nr:hypothetical protein TIFTF001_044306 [Ficus carica]